jgi:hypothetical protein
MKLVKKIYGFIAFLFFLGSVQYSTAQTLKEVFTTSESPLFYLGIDFTQARLIDEATANVTEIRDKHYAAINDLVVNEPKKYDLLSAFHKTNIDHDLGLVAKRNASINTEGILSTNSADYNRFKEDDIIKLVKGFNFGDKKGMGVLFIVEAMSKGKKGAAVWVTFINMGTHKVLLTERMEGKVSMSIGFRNYWANPIRDVIETIEKKKFNEWKSKYSS